MKKTKRLLAILFTALSSFVFLFIPAGFLTAQTEQAQWSAVMAGETLCGLACARALGLGERE